MKRIIIFDLHDTLSISRKPIDAEMVGLLTELLDVKPVAVVSGSTMEQFENELLKPLGYMKDLLRGLNLFPSEATEYYRWNDGWHKIYGRKLDNSVELEIKKSIASVRRQLDFLPEKTYGESVIVRGSQISYAILGVDAPLELKVGWDSDLKKRLIAKGILTSLLPEFDISIGGHTSVNISPKGVGKVNCIPELCDRFGIGIGDLLYIGNEFGAEGDDLPIKEFGVDCIEVYNPEQTKGVIKSLLTLIRNDNYRYC